MRYPRGLNKGLFWFLLSRSFRFFLVFVLITAWLFSGWPQIWQNPPFPPKIQEAQAAVAYFSSASNPTPDSATATLSGATPVAVTPPGSMTTGDLVIIVAEARKASATLAISETGGQSWTSQTATGNTLLTTIIFWARYNGTWSANPSVSFSDTTNTTVVMHVFRPSSTSNTWAIDVAQTNATFAAPSTPFTVTITGISTQTNGAFVFAVWATNDDNTWGSLTAGWSVAGSAQYRNIAGSDASQTSAYKIMATSGASGNVSQNQTLNGGDLGASSILAFKEVTAPTVTTQAATLKEATTATCNGTITVTGGANATNAGCQWDIDTGAPYANTASTAGDYGAVSFTQALTSLPAGTTIYARAFATNSAGTGYGGEVNFLTKPAAPTSLNFTLVTTTTLRLNWTASTGAASYKVERCTGTGCSSWTEIATGVTNVYYDDTGRTGNTVYRYQVRATNATGDSAYSSGAEQLTLPDTPGTPTFSLVTATTLRVSWAPPTGDAASYKVARCSGASCTPTDVYTGVTNTYYDDFSLTCNTLYRYKIRGTNTTGDGAYSSIAEQTTSACGLSTAILIRNVADNADVSTITFPAGLPEAVISNPTGNVNVQVLTATASEAAPVAILKSAAAYTLWYNVTSTSTWGDAVASEKLYTIAIAGELNLTTFGTDAYNMTVWGTDQGTTQTLAAGVNKELYLQVTLTALAGKTGTSTLTILGEAL